MAFKTFADGVALPASDLNTYLMKQSVIVCTSGTRPSSPVEGMAIYETDTDKLLIYTTATTTWQPPWNMPWGRLGGGSATTNQTGIAGSLTDITSLTTTVTLVANRRYRATMYATILQNTAGGNADCAIFSGATQIAGGAMTLGISEYGIFSVECEFTGSGSTTIKGQARTTAGTLTIYCSATNPAMLTVADIGPNAAPA